MTVSAQEWGVPTTESTVSRTRLLGRLLKLGERNLLLVAPSGYGKTVLAAQYVKSLQRPVLWLSMAGQLPEPTVVFQRLARILHADGSVESRDLEESPTQMDLTEAARSAVGVLLDKAAVLVLDDCQPCSRRAIGDVAASVLRDLAPFVDRVLITTRGLTREDLRSLDGWTIVERGDLALDTSEAMQMARVLGVTPGRDLVRGFVDSAGGHAALLAVMLSSADARLSPHATEPSLGAVALLEQLIDAHLSAREREVLEIAALLRECTSRELDGVGGPGAAEALRRISRVFPLVRCSTPNRDGQVLFIVHDLICDCIISQMGPVQHDSRVGASQSVLAALAERQDWARAREVLERLGTESDALQFISVHGQSMLSAHSYEQLLRTVGLVSLQHLMSSPRVLLYWSSALHEAGRMSESLAKANAALTLAEHERDYATLGLAAANKANTWIDQGKDQEAIECAEQYLARFSGRMPPRVRCELLLSYAGALAGSERQQEAIDALNRAASEAPEVDARYVGVRKRLERMRIFVEVLWTGDWHSAAQKIAPLLNSDTDTYYVRQLLRGNLAVALVELGRLSRAESLLRVVTNRGHALLDAAYLPTIGLVAAARGDYGGALELIRAGRIAAVDCGDDADIHVSLVYQSVIERASGESELALETAERAFESLSHRDFYSFSRLAAIEIAASLLVLGDGSAARSWIGPMAALDAGGNRYYALCGAMVLAVAEHRRGDPAAAVDLLAPFASYVRSESANWRMAMYCRTFPELLGLLAAAVGVESLPVHMLRILLLENAERCMRESREFLKDAEWLSLGQRTMGGPQFEEFLARKGRPICRVRLFGGLDVNIDERSIGERDWTKRKARLLFAMLVVRRGQEVPRDQVLEYLWPDFDETKARNNFYVAWSTMKATLMGAQHADSKCPYVEHGRERCRIVRDAVRSDVDEFEDLMEAARVAESSGDTASALRALSELMNVYRGDLLPGDLYDDWFSTLRDKYRLAFVDAMLKAVELLLEGDDPCEAVRFARRGLQAEPHREDLYQAALRCYIQAGQRSSAIETFIQCKTRMAEDLGLDPCAETIALYEQVLAMEERPRYDSFGLTADS